MLRPMLIVVFLLGIALVVVAVIGLFKKLAGGARGTLEIWKIKVSGTGVAMFFLVGVVLILVALAGMNGIDAKQSERLRREARDAIMTAITIDTDRYAPNSLRAAEDAKEQLDAELKVQEDRFVLFRSYREATELAAAAKAASEKAVADAEVGKEHKKNEAEAAIAEAKTMVAAARTALDSAPKGKGTQADLPAMRADLEAATSVISEAESVFNAEKYIDAKAKADGAKQTIQGVNFAIEQAKAAKEAARAKRDRE